MTSMDEPVLIFDLDGTVIESNSFVVWVKEILFGRIANLGILGRAKAALRCALALAHRKLLRQNHAHFKQHLQRIWSEATAIDDGRGASQRLVNRILDDVRPNLKAILSDVAAGRFDAVLSTAAPEDYALPLAQRLGFRHVIATPSADAQDRRENAGTVKRDRTLAYLREHGWVDRPRIFFTDHRDDLPLIRECGIVFWLGTYGECQAVRAGFAGAATVAARSLSDRDTYMRVLHMTGHDAAGATL